MIIAFAKTAYLIIKIIREVFEFVSEAFFYSWRHTITIIDMSLGPIALFTSSERTRVFAPRPSFDQS
jgi:hypothetical protein